ncbi:MAG: iron-containing alcohol dehydrogenase [Actinomycetota bacterium]|nr:iron-containing alcohol dehydrogenase [Actinomycetota bacterium]
MGRVTLFPYSIRKKCSRDIRIDTAKASNVILTHGGDLVRDWLANRPIPGPLNKHIAIPTTAGTGSEASIGAVIKDSRTMRKITIGNNYIAPDVAILDLLMTISLPPRLTAFTGIDALTHAIESFSCLFHSPVSDAFSCYSIRSIYKNLPVAFESGENIDSGYALSVKSPWEPVTRWRMRRAL